MNHPQKVGAWSTDSEAEDNGKLFYLSTEPGAAAREGWYDLEVQTSKGSSAATKPRGGAPDHKKKDKKGESAKAEDSREEWTSVRLARVPDEDSGNDNAGGGAPGGSGGNNVHGNGGAAAKKRSKKKKHQQPSPSMPVSSPLRQLSSASPAQAHAHNQPQAQVQAQVQAHARVLAQARAVPDDSATGVRIHGSMTDLQKATADAQPRGFGGGSETRDVGGGRNSPPPASASRESGGGGSGPTATPALPTEGTLGSSRGGGTGGVGGAHNRLSGDRGGDGAIGGDGGRRGSGSGERGEGAGAGRSMMDAEADSREGDDLERRPLGSLAPRENAPRKRSRDDAGMGGGGGD